MWSSPTCSGWCLGRFCTNAIHLTGPATAASLDQGNRVDVRKHKKSLRCLHTAEAAGSNPASPTSKTASNRWKPTVSARELEARCSNPDEYPEGSRKPSPEKYGYLQRFCELQKPPEKRRASLTRRSSLVRTQHRPLLKSGTCGKNVEDGRGSAEVLASSTPTQEFSSAKALNDVAFTYRQR